MTEEIKYTGEEGVEQAIRDMNKARGDIIDWVKQNKYRINMGEYFKHRNLEEVNILGLSFLLVHNAKTESDARLVHRVFTVVRGVLYKGNVTSYIDDDEFRDVQHVFDRLEAFKLGYKAGRDNR